MQLAALFDSVHELPNIPKVVQELIESFSDDDVNMDEVASKVAMDQVISAKVLRLANSSRFGGVRTISSVDDAVVRLGFSTLRTLVVASGVTGAFADTPSLDRGQFWTHSFLCASIGRELARIAGEDPETAYTCAMMQHIGDLLIHIAMPEEAKAIDAITSSGGDRAESQRVRLGFDYAIVGAELAQRWNFPELIVRGIREQLDPLSFVDTSVLAMINHMSDYLASATENMDEADVDNGEMGFEAFPLEIAEKLGLTAEMLLAEIDGYRQMDNEVAQLLTA